MELDTRCYDCSAAVAVTRLPVPNNRRSWLSGHWLSGERSRLPKRRWQKTFLALHHADAAE